MYSETVFFLGGGLGGRCKAEVYIVLKLPCVATSWLETEGESTYVLGIALLISDYLYKALKMRYHRLLLGGDRALNLENDERWRCSTAGVFMPA